MGLAISDVIVASSSLFIVVAAGTSNTEFLDLL